MIVYMLVAASQHSTHTVSIQSATLERTEWTLRTDWLIGQPKVRSTTVQLAAGAGGWRPAAAALHLDQDVSDCFFSYVSPLTTFCFCVRWSTHQHVHITIPDRYITLMMLCTASHARCLFGPTKFVVARLSEASALRKKGCPGICSRPDGLLVLMMMMTAVIKCFSAKWAGRFTFAEKLKNSPLERVEFALAANGQ